MAVTGQEVSVSSLSRKPAKIKKSKGRLAPSVGNMSHITLEADRKTNNSNGSDGMKSFNQAADSNGPALSKSKKKRRRKKKLTANNPVPGDHGPPLKKTRVVTKGNPTACKKNPPQNGTLPKTRGDQPKRSGGSNSKTVPPKRSDSKAKKSQKLLAKKENKLLSKKKDVQNGKSGIGKMSAASFPSPPKRIQTTWGIPKSRESNAFLAKKKAPFESLSFEDVGGFDWNATSKDLAKVVSGHDVKSDSEDEEVEEVVVKRKKLTPAEKRAKALEEERNMKRKERELLEAEENPQSPDHFERLLVGSPNSAEHWIKYMGYHILNADVEKARAVARRAIKRIDPQLTSAKLDVWIAFLNLEFTFSPPEVFKETFSEALKCNDDFSINSRVINLYADAKNVTEVDQLTNFMVKKYKNNMENWLLCQNALMTVGLQEKARNLLQKALNVLTKKEHVTLISRFALLENKHGFPEQAQALFENLLTSFPQRLDILSVYVDMLVKSNLIELSRSVLERAASNSLPVRKMKSIYLKWIAFEEAHGTPQDVVKVEEAAKKYVSDMMGPRQPTKKGIGAKPQSDIKVKKEEGAQEDDDNEEDEIDEEEFSEEE